MIPASVVPYRLTLMRAPRLAARVSNVAKSRRATATDTVVFFMLYKIRFACRLVNKA